MALPPHPCPHLYARQFPQFPNSWYESGTILHWHSGGIYYRGLIRGDGLVLSFDKRGTNKHPEATNSVKMIRKPCEKVSRFSLENWLFAGTPWKTWLVPRQKGNTTGLFVQGTIDGYHYD